MRGRFSSSPLRRTCTLSMAQESSALQGELGITLYRIVQECLTNISRHAEAGNVQISVSQQPMCVELSVHDDGRGFDPRVAGHGFGLLGIRERVKALGGSCDIESASGGGTTIVAQMPLSAQSGRR